MKGQSLSDSIGITKKLKAPSPIRVSMPLPNKKSMSVGEILKKNNFDSTDKKAVYSVKPKVSDTMGLTKKLGGNNVKFHTYIQNPNKRIKNIRVLVVKENSAQILAWRVYESR